jgi:predicted transcriptional regulator
VRPTWADSFFLDRNPKTIELRKGSFGTSLKAGDSIVIYATMPVAEILGIVKVVKRELLTVDRLWKESQQGQLAKVSRNSSRLITPIRNRVLGVWVSAAELFPSPIALCQTSPELGRSLATTTAIAGKLAHEQMALMKGE